jgi:hypothetical protein
MLSLVQLFILITIIIVICVAIYFVWKSEDPPQQSLASSASATIEGGDNLQLKGKTVLSSTGDIGWHLENKMCPGTNRMAELQQTSDPRIFGPIVWPGLHIMAENYPEVADKDHKKACVNFLRGLPWMLPCGHCGSHLLKREAGQGDVPIDELIDSLKDDDKRKQRNKNLRQACSSRKALRSYLVEAHNNVNQNTKKPKWTAADAKKRYCQIPVCLEPCDTYKEDKCKNTPGCTWKKNEDSQEYMCEAGWFEDGIPYPTSTPCTDEKV